MVTEVSHGRGGAGNINPDSTPYVDGEVVREGFVGSHGDGAYSAGRGGAGNIGDKGHPVTERKDRDIIPESAVRLSTDTGDYHTGRGGAGNEQKHKENGELADEKKDRGDAPKSDDAAYEACIAAEVGRLRVEINDAAVCRLASKLSGDKVCTLEHPYKAGAGALMGCANYHAWIRFQDGSPSWLLRVPRVLLEAYFNITGVIDWQMARVMPRREAFEPSLITANMAAPRSGKVSLSADDVALADALR
ncbi:hypothetical protein PWT90_05176 [Aphanocladium album]|nr:hypothetical protein PWT90_05176 [Aphanocladium album]